MFSRTLTGLTQLQPSCYYWGMLEACLQQLDLHKLRRTKNRETVLIVLHGAQGPLSPPAIVSACHTLGRQANKTTIYRELDLLERVGLIKRVMVSDRKQYFELTERGHHHHLVCIGCEGVEDITLGEHGFERQIKALARVKQFAVLRHSLEIFGWCKTCHQL